MAATDIVAADVRNRLGADTADITADQATQFIAYADAWEDKILALNSKSVSDLETYESALVKQAKIDIAAKMAIASIQLNSDEFGVGPIKVKGLSEKGLSELYEKLEENVEKILELLNWKKYTMTTRVRGGDDYTPGGDEGTMLDYGETTTQTPFKTLT